MTKFKLLWLDLLSFFVKIFSMSAVGWDLRIPRPCSSVSWAPHTIISLIRESWRLSNYIQNSTFLNQVRKSWTFLLSCCLYVTNLWQRMVVLFLGLQYSEDLWRTGAKFILSTDSKAKVSYIFPPFWPMYLRKMKVFI